MTNTAGGGRDLTMELKQNVSYDEIHKPTFMLLTAGYSFADALLYHPLSVSGIVAELHQVSIKRGDERARKHVIYTMARTSEVRLAEKCRDGWTDGRMSVITHWMANASALTQLLPPAHISLNLTGETR